MNMNLSKNLENNIKLDKISRKNSTKGALV